jgi:hypothetical protein
MQVVRGGRDDQVRRPGLRDDPRPELAVIALLRDRVDELALGQQRPHEHGRHVTVALLGDLAQGGRLEHDDGPVLEPLVGVEQRSLGPACHPVEGAGLRLLAVVGVGVGLDHAERGAGGVGLAARGRSLDHEGHRLG